jgi:CRP/FNR family cyclic AMP-dependent transcriptional regulator
MRYALRVERMSRRSHVLLEDPELAEQLRADRLAEAVRACVARTLTVSTGAWTPAADVSGLCDGAGLLILDGLIVRRVGVYGRFGAELLGEGDLLRPWQREDVGAALPRTGRWRALSRCRIAVLDAGFTARAGGYPEVVSALLAKAIRRSRQLAVNMAIVHHPRVDVRLHMLLWHLADRWGSVHPDGVHVPLNLTHAVLADLVAARRPTVSKALAELADRGAVEWTGADWLLQGEPPAELDAVGRVSVARRASTDSSHPEPRGVRVTGSDRPEKF